MFSGFDILIIFCYCRKFNGNRQMKCPKEKKEIMSSLGVDIAAVVSESALVQITSWRGCYRVSSLIFACCAPCASPWPVSTCVQLPVIFRPGGILVTQWKRCMNCWQVLLESYVRDGSVPCYVVISMFVLEGSLTLTVLMRNCLCYWIGPIEIYSSCFAFWISWPRLPTLQTVGHANVCWVETKLN